MKPDCEFNPAPPLLVVLSGPSGVGKDAALTKLRQLDRPWRFVVTATTRPQRPVEQDGVDYIFMDEDTFLDMKDKEQFLECAQVYGRWYGVPRSQVQDGLAAGQDVILKIDVQGAETVRKVAPQAVSVFMVPESLEDLRLRLSRRMGGNPSDTEVRLEEARREMDRLDEFDYCVVNRDGRLDQTIEVIDAIITAEKRRVVPRRVRLT